MISVYPEAAGFLDRVQGLLEEHEVENNLILGVVLRLKNFPGWFSRTPYLAVVEEGGIPVLAAAMTPPYRVIIAAFQPDVENAMEQVSRSLVETGWKVPGANGPVPLSKQFAAVWQRVTGQAFHLNMSERVYELRQVTPPAGVPGQLRIADEGDISLIARWIEAFHDEAVPTDPPSDWTEWAASRTGSGSLFLWEDGQPVSMAMSSRPISHGISVGSVYTPPEKRARGYASALVASLSQRMLDQGYQFCTLFTNLANPTSNSIYQKLGYRPVCDFEDFIFKNI